LLAVYLLGCLILICKDVVTLKFKCLIFMMRQFIRYYVPELMGSKLFPKVGEMCDVCFFVNSNLLNSFTHPDLVRSHSDMAAGISIVSF